MTIDATTTTAAELSAATIEQLRSRVRGGLILPRDSGYDEARAVYNGMIDRRPPAPTADIVPGSAQERGGTRTEGVDDSLLPRRDRPVIRTTIACAVAAIFGHVVLWIGAAAGGSGTEIFWQPAVGMSIAAVAVIAFGGFFLASERARTAIAASFPHP